MRIENVAFCTTDWATVPATVHPGETGTALWRTLEIGNIRVRMVEYTPGYRADHWCSRGHVLLVLDGELVTELAAMTNRPQSSRVLRSSASLTTPASEPRSSIGKVRATVTTATQKAEPVTSNV